MQTYIKKFFFLHIAEADINYLMMQALRRVAPLPWTLLVDQWRWKDHTFKLQLRVVATAHALSRCVGTSPSDGAGL